MRNSKLWESLHYQVDEEALKALEKLDKMEKHLPRQLAEGAPRGKKSRLQKYLNDIPDLD